MIELLSALSAAGFECLVVDDGSGTDYAGIFDRARQYAEVITHGENRGKGAAIKTGLRHIADVHSDSRIIVTVDADGQHRPEDVLRVCEDARGPHGRSVPWQPGLHRQGPAAQPYGKRCHPRRVQGLRPCPRLGTPRPACGPST
jgi:glycosyltransferase involved in cell wall biosynthesis